MISSQTLPVSIQYSLTLGYLFQFIPYAADRDLSNKQTVYVILPNTPHSYDKKIQDSSSLPFQAFFSPLSFS